MNAPHPKRGQVFEETDSSLNAAKRVRFSLDRLDGCETSETTTTTGNGNWDQVLEFTDLQAQGAVELDSFYFDDDVNFSVLENPVPGSDIALVEYPLSSSQPVVRQDEESTEVCY